MVFLYILLSLFSCQLKNTEIIDGDLNIIPLPVQMEGQSGHFIIDQDTWIQSDSFPDAAFDPIKVFEETFKRKSGYNIPRHNEKISKNDEKHLILIVRSGDHNIKENYSLHISTVGIIINASNEAGVFYALQTLRTNHAHGCHAGC
jgi:hexosaminidase